MTSIELTVLVSYFLVLGVLALYGWHRYYLVYLHWKHRANVPSDSRPLRAHPRVTIQLPVFNEVYVVERLIDAVCGLDYPRDRIEFQVLDDSTDETRDVVAAAVARQAARGVPIRHLRRTDRAGFKAGALAAGLREASGEFIAVFDADFVPSADFLRRTLPHFDDSGVGLVSAEVPVEMNAFKAQQHRWAKGSVQTCRKLLPRILRSSLPWRVKAEAVAHLTANVNYVLMVLLSLLMVPAMYVRHGTGWQTLLVVDVPLFAAATVSVGTFYVASQRAIHHDWLRRLRFLPMLMAAGIGLSVNNARAVIEGLVCRGGEFTRTAKYGVERSGDDWLAKRYRRTMLLQPLIETGLGLYFTVGIWYASTHQLYASLPFLVLFQAGFLYTGFLSIAQQCCSDVVRLTSPIGRAPRGAEQRPVPAR